MEHLPHAKWFGPALAKCQIFPQFASKRASQRSTNEITEKSFWTARIVSAGIETIHMIRKGQMKVRKGQCALTDAELFYALAA